MTPNPDCFRSFAQTLLDNDISNGDENKVKHCTVVNRSYYAVFLCIRHILDKTYGQPPQKSGDHKRIRNDLIGVMHRRDLFQTLKTLWKDRVKADYAINQIGNTEEDFEKFAKNSLFSAEWLLNQLK